MLDALIWKCSHSLSYGGEALDLWGCETLSCCQKKPPAFNIIFVNFAFKKLKFATNYWLWTMRLEERKSRCWLFGDLKGKYCYCLSAQPPTWKPRENRKRKIWAKIHFCWTKKFSEELLKKLWNSKTQNVAT